MFQQSCERNCLFPFHRLRVRECGLGSTYTIDDDEMRLCDSVGRNGLQFGRIDNADAAPLHLLEEETALDGTHEHNDFDWLDISARRDHIDGDGDARVVAVAEILNQVLRAAAGAQIRDLLAEVVAFAELLTEDANDVLGMAVVLGENQCLGNFLASGKDLAEETILEGLGDQANLIFGYNGTVKILRLVLNIFIWLLPSLGARASVAFADKDFGAGLDL